MYTYITRLGLTSVHETLVFIHSTTCRLFVLFLMELFNHFSECGNSGKIYNSDDINAFGAVTEIQQHVLLVFVQGELYDRINIKY